MFARGAHVGVHQSTSRVHHFNSATPDRSPSASTSTSRIFAGPSSHAQPQSLHSGNSLLGYKPQAFSKPTDSREDDDAFSRRVDVPHASLRPVGSSGQQQAPTFGEQRRSVPEFPLAKAPQASSANASTNSYQSSRSPAPTSGPQDGSGAVADQTKTKTVKVKFTLKFKTEWGQSVKCIGSHAKLGNWQLDTAPLLKWSEGDMWNTTVELPAGSVYEYKYVVVQSSDLKKAEAWQRGNNCVLAVKPDDTEVSVYDNWEGQPGAAVVSGGKSVTRETQLLTWASEMSDMIKAQRSELRQAKMELWAAQEDTKAARQEAARLRTELSQATRARLEAERKLQDLEDENRRLRTQMMQAQINFKSAMEEAKKLLEDAYLLTLGVTRSTTPADEGRAVAVAADETGSILEDIDDALSDDDGDGDGDDDDSWNAPTPPPQQHSAPAGSKPFVWGFTSRSS